MAITLPYSFDTSRVFRTILKGAVGLELVIVVGIVYSLAAGHMVAVLQLCLIGAILLVFGRIIFKHSSGSVGTITRDGVVIRRGELYGMRLPGPAGEFALRRFKAVRVGPTVLIARADSDSRVGQEIASLLGLPCEAKHAPY